MKYSIFLKGIALILCTVSLLGILCSGFGIFALTEGELYSQTVEQMLDKKVQQQGQGIAQTLAARYASTTLGNADPQFVSERFPLYHYGILNDNYGYAIADAQGNVLESLGSAAGDDVRTYSFLVPGQYIHQISSMTEEEKYPGFQLDPETYTRAIITDSLYLYEAVPPEGASVTDIILAYADGDTVDYSAGQIIGSVYYTKDGFLVGRFEDSYGMLHNNKTVTDLVLAYHGELLVEARSAVGVGHFTRDPRSGELIFYSHIRVEDLMNPQEAAVPKATVEETQVQETTATETVPETTAETIPETKVPEVTAKIEDNIPDGKAVRLVELYYTYANGEKIERLDEYGIGAVRRLQDGTILFTAFEDYKAEPGELTLIRMVGEDGNAIFQASCEEGIGKLYYNDDNLVVFRSDLPQPPAEETVPETTIETVPETTEAETVPETIEETTAEVFATTEPVIINGKPLWEYEVNNDTYFDFNTQQTVHAEFVYIPMPEYTVELYLTEDSFNYGELYEILEILRVYRNYLLPVLGGCLLVFLICVIYLFFAAARKSGTDVRLAGGLNRIPLDLYTVMLIMGIPCLCMLALEGCTRLMRQDMLTGCACALGCCFAACALAVGFLFAVVAQCKTPGGFWWKNTMFARLIRLIFRLSEWMGSKCKTILFPFAAKVTRKVWMIVCTCLVWLYRGTEKCLLKIGHILGFLGRWLKDILHRFLSLLPLTWQWLIAGFVMLLMIALIFATNGEEILVVLCIFGSVSLIVYGAYCFGTLLDSTKKMRKGDLDTKVDDKMMVGSFREFAGELNELAGVAVVAAQKQLNSERMKSELITNVSHDIKTPLTSIINYVDLLQKPHTREDEAQYLEVLARQSQQLKKLLEDLMDMSKASTGNMNVEITCLDAVESINQALGEFSDKLEKARLTPIFRHTEPSVRMMADGRLVWRVLNNLLGNAVKYAMPGTRLYLDLVQMDDTVVISLKNISREELSVNAEELLERFVRGDDSRNTEGSGLGLNIAKSLMELQKGQMQLLIDGDLFKVTLIFPTP